MTNAYSSHLPNDKQAALDCMGAAIDFVVEGGVDRLDFLYLWREGEFEQCRNGWPDAPEACYPDADPFA